jgi:hypothetical protein
MTVYCLAGLAFRINVDNWLLDPNFIDFVNKFEAGLVNIDIVFDDIPAINEIRLLVDSPRQSYFEGTQGTVVKFHHEDDILTMMTADLKWRNCKLYLKTKYKDPQNYNYVQFAKDRLKTLIMEIFTAVLALNNGLHVHSVALNWQGNGIVFAAPSGVGKSTHAHLWKANYDVSILDGDVSACRIIEGKPLVFGLPWCGTSEEYMNSSVPLKAVVFLEQADENHIIKLEKSEAVMRLISGSFLPFWSEYLMEQVFETANQLSDKVACFLLRCRPDREAVEMVIRCIKN